MVPAHAPLHRPRCGILLALLVVGCSDDGATTPPTTGAGSPSAPAAGSTRPGAQARPTDEGPPRFLARQEVEVPGRSVGCTVGDLDGDRRPDLVVTLEDPGALLVFASSRGGLAGAPVRVAVGGYPLPAVVAHGSGGRELFVASRATEELQRVAADGTVAGRWPLDAAPRALATGDLGADGIADAVVASVGGQLDVFTADGSTWRTSVADGRATCLHVAGDGATVWIGSQLPAGLRAFRAADLLAPAGPPEPIAELALAGIPRALVETDVDGDGDPELVCAGGDEDLWVLGAGSTGDSTTWADAAPLRSAAPGLVPVALEAADLDGDGVDELLTIQFYDSGYGAVGQFVPEAGRFRMSLSEYAGQAPVDLAVADFDGDGTRDLAIANSDARRVSVLPGTGIAQREKDAFYQARRTAVGINPLAVAAGDLNGDGAPEALVANGSEGTLSVLTNEYSLLGARRDIPVGPSPTEILALDVDGDGAVDAVTLIRPPEGARLAILFGDGQGGLDARGREPVDLGGDAADLAAVDLDGDGGRELVCADPLGARLIVIDVPRPMPAGWVPTPAVIPVGGTPASVCAVATDSAVEHLAVALAGSPPRLEVFTRSGYELRRLATAPATGHPVDLASGDIDGDGRADLAWLARHAPGDNQGYLRVYLARGDALEPGPEYATGLAPAELVVGDLDGDRRADLAVAAQNTHNTNVWLSRENGVLQRWPDLGAGLGCLGLELADLNLDGRLDLLVANAFSHDLSVIYNLPR